MSVSTQCLAYQSASRSSQPSVSSVETFQGMPVAQQYGVSQSSPPANTSITQEAPSADNGSALGIPKASLVDPIFEISDPNSLQQLQSIDTRGLNRNEQLAFWFNLYNARTVDLVLDNYPIRSVRQIKQKFTDFVGPFDDAGAVNVLGKSLSLNDIESGIVRPVWNDPRIHYALNCASFGCPNLSPKAWTAQTLDGDLNGAAYEYVNSGRAVKRSLRGIRTAKIYKWYKDDFGGSDQDVLNHIRQYADANTQNILSRQQKIAGYFYDWSLNDGRIIRRRLLEPLIR